MSILGLELLESLETPNLLFHPRNGFRRKRDVLGECHSGFSWGPLHLLEVKGKPTPGKDPALGELLNETVIAKDICAEGGVMTRK